MGLVKGTSCFSKHNGHEPDNQLDELVFFDLGFKQLFIDLNTNHLFGRLLESELISTKFWVSILKYVIL